MTPATIVPPSQVLEDVRDVQAFAVDVVRRSALVRKGKITGAELEEAQLEAVVLIYELHGDWDPARCARFSAFLLTYLPKRLVSWYRVNLRQSGRGRWSGSTGEYKYNGMVSLDDRLADDGEDRDRLDSALTVYHPGS